MARPLRLAVLGGVYHVVSRGNEKRAIYLDESDRNRFLKILESVTERLNVLCHSYCLMGNHYHLILETPDANISLAVRQLNGVYAQYFNRKYERVGHLFQGRFASKLIQKHTYLLAVSRYVALNPVRAKLVSRPSDWRWSSFRALAGLTEPPTFLCTDWLLHQFDTDDRSRACRSYRRFVLDSPDSESPGLDDRPILGTADFVSRFKDRLQDAAELRDIPRRQRFAARPSLRALFRDCPDRDTRNRQILSAYADHGYRMAEIAESLALSPSTISRAVRNARIQDLTP